MITVDWLGTASFRIPFPVQFVREWSGGAHSNPAPSRFETRMPDVRQAGPDAGAAILDYPALPGGYGTGPFGGHRTTEVRWLDGVATLDEALDHFCSLQALSRDLILPATHVHYVRGNRLVTVDLSKMGCAPGNAYVYIITRPDRTLYFGPTHYFKYDWQALTFLADEA